TNADLIQRAAAQAATLGRFDEAITLDHRAIELDPLRVTTYRFLGDHLFYAGRLKEAEEACLKVLELNPERPAARRNLGHVYLAQSNPGAARAEMMKEKEEGSRWDGLAIAYLANGKKKEAEDAFVEYIEKFQDVGVFQIEKIYAYRREIDKA